VHAALSGVTLPARLTLRDSGETLADFAGSFLFTHTGYSGPVALNISRHVERVRWERPKAAVYARFLPDVEDGGEGRFWDALVRRSARKALSHALSEYLPRRVAEMVASVARVPPAAPVGRLDAGARNRVLAAVLDQRLPVSGIAGYRKAEATAGGVALDEVEPATMMSRLVPGLFFAGETLDVDGHLGGYNFQWAWSSGTVAGRAAGRWKNAGGS
jgi:predicted Rossmann fold flavoprotein